MSVFDTNIPAFLQGPDALPGSRRPGSEQTQRRRIRIQIGRRLRDRREYLGLSRARVARSLGIQEKGYGHYETGIRPLTVESLVVLADCLGVPASYFFGEAQAEGEISSEEWVAVQSLREMSPDVRLAALAALLAMRESGLPPEGTFGMDQPNPSPRPESDN